MKKIVFILLSAIVLFSCSEEDLPMQNPFVVAFKDTSANFLKISGHKEVKLVFSEEAQYVGEVKLKVSLDGGIEYGKDFTTVPEMKKEEIILPFKKGDKELSFRFNNLMKNFSATDSDKSVQFIIEQIEYKGKYSIQGYTTYDISYDIKVAGDFSPKVGGPTEPNQVYMDLSTGEAVVVKRDSWDLGFYSGDKFRVTLNGSLFMATTALDGNDIDSFTTENINPELFEKVQTRNLDVENVKYVDAPSGNIDSTAIAEINADASENKVYLLNLGSKVPPKNTEVKLGSVILGEGFRGWKKIRILRKGNGYLLQYADLDDTTHKEIEIPKRKEYNFNFISFSTESIVDIEPPKKDWDICYTVFTNIIQGAGSYGFSDFVVDNILADARAFQVEEKGTVTYENYKFNRVEAEAKLSNDQRAIGSHWRSVFQKDVYPDKFYVIKDPEGNWYKIKFLALTNTSSVRGYPRFQYKLLTDK